MRIFKEPDENDIQMKDIASAIIKRPQFSLTCVCLYFYAFSSFIFFVMIILSPLLFLQEFSKDAAGRVVKVKSVHGGEDLYLDDGTVFHWIIGADHPQIGELLKKEMYSFRYIVNGKNVMTHSDAMELTSIRIPSRYVFPLFLFLIVFQFYFFHKYKLTPWEVVLNRVNFDEEASGKLYDPKSPALHFDLALIPIIFMIYSIQYFLMFFWI